MITIVVNWFAFTNVIIFFFNANEVSFGSNNDLETYNQAVLDAFCLKISVFIDVEAFFCVQKAIFHEAPV